MAYGHAYLGKKLDFISLLSDLHRASNENTFIMNLNCKDNIVMVKSSCSKIENTEVC